MAVGVTEIHASTAVAVAVIDLAGLPAGGVGEEGDAGVLDAGECGVELLVAGQERVVARLDAVLALVIVQGDPVG